MTPAQIGPVVGSYCPNVLFPYAREAIANLITRGGFPTVNLAPVNFDAAYQQHMQQTQQDAANTAADQPTQH
jgi:preprotein translocase subunit SecB